MTQYNSVHVKLSNSQLDKLQLATKNGGNITLKPSSSIISNATDETNFSHKLLLTDKLQSFVRFLSAIFLLRSIKHLLKIC